MKYACSMFCPDIPFYAKASFSLLPILLGLLNEPADSPSWPGLIRGKSCCFIAAAAATQWGV